MFYRLEFFLLEREFRPAFAVALSEYSLKVAIRKNPVSPPEQFIIAFRRIYCAFQIFFRFLRIFLYPDSRYVQQGSVSFSVDVIGEKFQPFKC